MTNEYKEGVKGNDADNARILSIMLQESVKKAQAERKGTKPLSAEQLVKELEE